MAYTMTGQRPAVLNPVHTMPIKGAYDPLPHIRAVLVDPLYQPLNPGTSVSILDDQNNPLDPDEAMDIFLRAVGENVDAGAETKAKDLLQQGLVRYDRSANLLVNETFAVQAGTQNKLPAPRPGVLYGAQSDVLPAAKSLLSGSSADDSEFFASLAYTYSPNTLGFWFQSQAAFEDFQAWLATEINQISSVLPGSVNALFGQFGSLKLKGLTESLILRNSDDSENDEFSFARVLVHMLMSYQRHQQQASPAVPVNGVLPFTLPELFLPKTVVLVNLEAHARVSASKIDREWKLINASISSPIKVVSNKSLSKLTALPRAAAKAAAAAANASSNRRAQQGKAANVTFRKKAPTSVDLSKGLIRVLKRMKEVNRSQNIFRKSKTTFAKPNRRDPFDHNRPGRITSVHYLPDLHIYLDCSGSISVDNYQDAVIMLIRMAKKLNINLYFNSFSHIMSQEVMLRTQGKSTSAIWREFRRLPKVQGGTDYEQIWHYINYSKKRKNRLSLVISDFEWMPPSTRMEHPKNLYYAPISTTNWDTLRRYAKNFSQQMTHIEPAIHQRLIGVVN